MILFISLFHSIPLLRRLDGERKHLIEGSGLLETQTKKGQPS
jgi:hypothetical protein